MIHRILMVALIAGCAAGIGVTVFQAASVLPLIEKAERIEMGLSVDAPPEAGHASDPTRFSGTLLSNVLTGFGFGLVLVAVYAMSGTRLDGRRGIFWGIGGFVAVALLPALGLPPEPPGAPSVPLEAAQTWWLLTILLSATALLMLAFSRRRLIWILAVMLAATPHIYGAPTPDGVMDPVLETMIWTFRIASLTATAVFWTILGGVSGFLYGRIVDGTDVVTPSPEQDS